MTENVLVTRPQAQASLLMQALQAHDFQPISFPTLQIEAAGDIQHIKNVCQNLSQSIVILSSANAVHYALPYWPKTSKPIEIIAIGPSTAKALLQHGRKVSIIPKQYNSEGVLALPLLQNITEQTILLFCGEDPRPLLKQTLLTRQATVTEVICYKRICPKVNSAELANIIQQPIAVIIATSLSSLKNLHAIFKQNISWLLKIPLLVISPKMQQFARELGFVNIICADNPTNENITQTLIQWRQDKKSTKPSA